MDSTERQAHEHLAHRGFAHIEYEPDGNRPPDFLLDSRIAVEVRRLNQRDPATGYGLEHEYFPLSNRIQRLFESFGAPNASSWWVSIRFRRPVERWVRLRPKVRRFLEAVATDVTSTQRELDVGYNFTILAHRAETPLESAFLLSTINDYDAGGMVVAEVVRNLLPCLSEKWDKIAPYRDRYPEWWLVLVDYVGHGMSDFSRRQFSESVTIDHDWDKVVLLTPGDPTSFLEIEAKRREA